MLVLARKVRREESPPLIDQVPDGTGTSAIIFYLIRKIFTRDRLLINTDTSKPKAHSCHPATKQTHPPSVIMSFTALQAASLIALHATFTKILTSFTLRTYLFLETDAKRKQKVNSNFYIQEFQKAQTNESEYAGLLTMLLLFFATQENVDVSNAATLSVVGQVGYVWTRTLIGYPKIPTITFAIVRYGGLGLLAWALFTHAYGNQ
jgi:hypothetical protein